jgi:hypothetical protein
VTDQACRIVGEFAGIRLGPCGKPATHSAVGTCEQGHTCTRRICTEHARIFAEMPDTVWCDNCDQAGVESRMAITINKETP